MKHHSWKLIRRARGANFVEYMVLVALAIGAVYAGAQTLGGAMEKGTKQQQGKVEKLGNGISGGGGGGATP